MKGAIWLRIGDLFPSFITDAFERKLWIEGDKVSKRKIIGFLMALPFMLGALAGFDIFFVYKSIFYAIGAFFAAAVIILFAIYVVLDYYELARVRRVEQNLPNALELVATNVNSGLTVENALVESARPEFGELALLLKRAAKEMFSGRTLEEALTTISKKVNSYVLGKTIWLLIEGIKKGGSFGSLLLRVSKDLREEEAINSEIKANISMYIFLIIIAAAIGAPMLFGSGVVVSQMMSDQKTISIPENVDSHSIPFISTLFGDTTQKQQVPFEMIRFFSFACLFCTSFFASLLIGIIRYGRELAGLRFFPILIIVSLAVYFIAVLMLGQMIGLKNIVLF